MVWNHQSICEINIFVELYCHHFGIYLNDHSFQPISDPFRIFIIVIAENFNAICDIVFMHFIGTTHESQRKFLPQIEFVWHKIVLRHTFLLSLVYL